MCESNLVLAKISSFSDPNCLNLVKGSGTIAATTAPSELA